jgi:hypothetical protein
MCVGGVFMLDWLFSSTAGMVVFIIAGMLVLYLCASVIPQLVLKPKGTRLLQDIEPDPLFPGIEAYINTSGEKYVLTAEDVQTILTHEKKNRNNKLLLAAVCMFFGGLAIAIADGGIGVAIAGGLSVAIGIFIAWAYTSGANKKISAVQGGRCAARILKVDEKLWHVSTEDDTPSYSYYIRCGETIVCLPNSRRIYNSIGGHMLAVTYFYDPQRNIISYYPAAM